MKEENKKAILVEIIKPGVREISDDSFEEFKLLIETLGIEIAGETDQLIRKPNYAFFLGKGKVNEIRQIVKLLHADFVFIDTKLTYLQLKNLTKEIGVPVMDRPHLILMIFSMRARTKEAKLQVELTQLKMHLPQIVQSGEFFDQQTGSEIGLKGPGEKKTELKRRYIEKRINVLEKKLEEIGKQRELRRKKRRKSKIPIVAIVGYTNSGKSTLLNKLTRPDAYVEDMLFSTLDTLVREGELSENRKVLFVDTIGFIRDLPPALIYSFHSTLEEILDAWVIVHLVDASAPDLSEKMSSVRKTIKELGASDVPNIMVFNKIDKIPVEKLLFLHNKFPEAVFISALNNIGIDELKSKIEEKISSLYARMKFLVPYERQDVISAIYEIANVISVENKENGTEIIAEGFKNDLLRFKKFVI